MEQDKRFIDASTEIEAKLNGYSSVHKLPDGYFNGVMDALKLQKASLIANPEIKERIPKSVLQYMRDESNDEEFFSVAGALLVALGVFPTGITDISVDSFRNLVERLNLSGKKEPKSDIENLRFLNLPTSIPNLIVDVQYAAGPEFTDADASRSIEHGAKTFIYPIFVEFFYT